MLQFFFNWHLTQLILSLFEISLVRFECNFIFVYLRVTFDITNIPPHAAHFNIFLDRATQIESKHSFWKLLTTSIEEKTLKNQSSVSPKS